MLWHMLDGWVIEMEVREVALFRNGRNQAIRIPREFELDGTTALISKEAGQLIIKPLPPKSRLLETLARLEPLAEGLPDIEDPFISDDVIFE